MIRHLLSRIRTQARRHGNGLFDVSGARVLSSAATFFARVLRRRVADGFLNLRSSCLGAIGIAMTPLPAWAVAGTLAAAAVFAILLDFVKAPVVQRRKIT